MSDTTTETQWRACAKDDGDLVPEHGSRSTDGWTNDEFTARASLAAMSACTVPYDAVWLEQRTATYTEPERVE